MPYPDFLIIGAMKCGTTTLAAQLGRQDGVFVCDPKEPFYFSDDAVHARGPDWYRGLFAAAAPGDLKGEGSTRY
ncbi:MAG: sulfotransferase, partial [Shimia sp.]